MRLRHAWWLLILVVPSAAAAGPHGPYVSQVHHEPSQPLRGQALTVHAVLADGVNATSVSLTHCRFDPAYACAVEYDVMEAQEGGSYVGTIGWDARFFYETTWVGYNLFIDLDNGTTVKAPAEYVPAAPAGLPEGADIYYVYELTDPDLPTAPGPTAAWAAALLGIVIGGMRRRLHAA